MESDHVRPDRLAVVLDHVDGPYRDHLHIIFPEMFLQGPDEPFAVNFHGAVSATLEYLVERVAGLVDRNEYKRRQAPPGVRITERAFGRDRRYPITSGYQNFQKEALF